MGRSGVSSLCVGDLPSSKPAPPGGEGILPSHAPTGARLVDKDLCRGSQGTSDQVGILLEGRHYCLA